MKMSNVNPEWNEHFKLIVQDPETQVLELHVYDWEKVKMHDKLGMQVIPLRLLTPCVTNEFTLDLLKNLNLNNPQNKRNRGTLVVELKFDPFKEENGRFSCTSDGDDKLSGISRATHYISSNGGVLLVTIDSAEDAEEKHHNTPYAQILFRQEKKKTRMIRKSRDPRWNEEFQFMLEEVYLSDKKEELQLLAHHKEDCLCHQKPEEREKKKRLSS